MLAMRDAVKRTGICNRKTWDGLRTRQENNTGPAFTSWNTKHSLMRQAARVSFYEEALKSTRITLVFQTLLFFFWWG